jgi:N-methylhydantoinase A
VAAREERDAVFGGGQVRAEVLRGEPRAGERFDGPALLELPETTVVVPPGWSVVTLANGTVSLERPGMNEPARRSEESD